MSIPNRYGSYKMRLEVWGVHGLRWLVRILPLSWQLRFGRFLGRMLYYAMPKRRKIARCNMRHCLPHLASRPRAWERMVRHNFASFGQGLIETAVAWFADPLQLAKMHTEFSGKYAVERALTRGKGLIILGTHMHALDLFGRLTAAHIPLIPTYRQLKNPLVNAIMEAARGLHFPSIVERHAVRDMIRLLRANKILWIAVDQDFGREHSEFVPFLGKEAATLTTVVKLAKLTGAAVSMASTLRTGLPHSPSYRIAISEPWDNFPSTDLLADLQRMNACIGDLICQDPLQYLWQHRRFKTRPPNTPSLYD